MLFESTSITVCLAIAAIVVSIEHMPLTTFSVRFRHVETWLIGTVTRKSNLVSLAILRHTCHVRHRWSVVQDKNPWLNFTFRLLHLNLFSICFITRMPLQASPLLENRSSSPDVPLSVTTSPSKLVKVNIHLLLVAVNFSSCVLRRRLLAIFSSKRP